MPAWRPSSHGLGSEPPGRRHGDPTPAGPGSGPTCGAGAGSRTKARRTALSPDPPGGGRAHSRGLWREGPAAGAAVGGPPPLCPRGASRSSGEGLPWRQSPDSRAGPGGALPLAGRRRAALPPRPNAGVSLGRGRSPGTRASGLGALKRRVGGVRASRVSGQRASSSVRPALGGHGPRRSFPSRRPPAEAPAVSSWPSGLPLRGLWPPDLLQPRHRVRRALGPCPARRGPWRCGWVRGWHLQAL